MESYIENDCITIEDDIFAFEILDMRRFDKYYNDFKCFICSMYMRYSEFENKESDPYWHEGDEFWHILPSYESNIELFRIYEDLP